MENKIKKILKEIEKEDDENKLFELIYQFKLLFKGNEEEFGKVFLSEIILYEYENPIHKIVEVILNWKDCEKDERKKRWGEFLKKKENGN